MRFLPASRNPFDRLSGRLAAIPARTPYDSPFLATFDFPLRYGAKSRHDTLFLLTFGKLPGANPTGSVILMVLVTIKA